MNFKRFILLFIIILLISGGSIGGTTAVCRHFDMQLAKAAEKLNVFSASAAIIMNNKVIWRKDSGKSANKNNLYCIGSISKSFVAVLALILEQEGSISLTDTTGKYLPHLRKWNKDNVTLEELLSMRSGIADYLSDFDREDYFKDYDSENLIYTGLFRSALLKKGDFTYSNTNILIAAQMIEKATGRKCEELIKEKILIPMELDDTYFAEDKYYIGARIVSGYSDTKANAKVEFTGTSYS